MKKLLLLLIVSSGLVNVVNAQRYEYGEAVPVRGHGNSSESNVRFGLFLAPSISWMKPTTNKSDDKQYLVNSEGSKLGFTWGLMIDYFFAENYGIATGFHINSSGGKITTTLNQNVGIPQTPNYVNSAYFDYRLQYLEIPFGLKLRSDELPMGIRVVGQLGISAGINISKKADYDVTYTDNQTGIAYNVTATKEKIQGTGITPVLLELNLGAGIEYPITEKLSIYTGLFFNNGFAPDVTNPKQFDLDYKGTFTDANTRLNNIALRIGLFF